MKRKISIISVLVLFLSLITPLSAVSAEETNSTLTKESIKSSELGNFNYLLYKPENSSGNMPLIVYLHGGSGKGNDLDILTSNDGFPKYVNDGTISNIPAYVVIPQLPSNKNGWADVKVSLKELINYLSKTYNIDSNKISLTGHSMGGTGTWNIALSYPDLFSCIAPMSGSIDTTESNINALSNMPVWAFVGADDTIVDPTSSIEFIETLQEKNSNAKITIFDGATHFDVPELAYLDSTINIVNWLASNSK
ncbi:alpha/beta hydrolase-fold protein [Clostridium sp. SHJSY1]|uniref:carboxylesterase family protein n=1 Tax=Clostridium sp. SHJSY1 TaxID=2942483 RepID=UPI0028750433|nr:alpha/beta hydrolase-fold protein [Clostridium sp. SHJSY1]MDS0527079.1 alpha/beta hydrolase-fold protein [Clostridium sp. SHJSY1]